MASPPSPKCATYPKYGNLSPVELLRLLRGCIIRSGTQGHSTYFVLMVSLRFCIRIFLSSVPHKNSPQYRNRFSGQRWCLLQTPNPAILQEDPFWKPSGKITKVTLWCLKRHFCTPNFVRETCWFLFCLTFYYLMLPVATSARYIMHPQRTKLGQKMQVVGK